MKKLLALILAAALLLSLPACGQPEEAGPLRVLIDVEFAGGYANNSASAAGDNLLFNLSLYPDAPEDIELEYLPKEGDERDAALTRLRTEILSGKGPDVFICSTEYPASEEHALFRFPEQAMAQKIFLPLDEYIENAQFMEWGKLTPAIMEAGRSEEGQELLPLAFTMPVTCFRKSEVSHEPSKTLTYAQMEQGDAALYAASVLPGVNPWTAESSYFTELADWSTEELAFTEDELRDWALGSRDKFYQYIGAEPADAPAHFQSNLEVDFVDSLSAYEIYHWEDQFDGIDTAKEPLTFVPFYSKDGGYIASITCFGAVNRNCKRPAEAFYLLDYLLSAEGQRSSLSARFTEVCAWPVHEDLCAKDRLGPGKFCTLDENIQALKVLRDNLASARFTNPLDKEIWNLDVAISQNEYAKSQGSPSKEPEKLVEEAYRTMKMMVAES